MITYHQLKPNTFRYLKLRVMEMAYSRLGHNPYPSVDLWDLWVSTEYGFRQRSLLGPNFRIKRHCYDRTRYLSHYRAI